MRKTASIFGAALALAGGTAAAQSSSRLVVIVARPGDALAQAQTAELARHQAALHDRDVVVQEITPEVARRDRQDLDIGAGDHFSVLLVGKDGGVKLRRDKPVQVSELEGLIDAMPMRRDEVARRR